MTGPSEGKIEIQDAKVYIHVKGKSNARITHIDIESPAINENLVGATYPCNEMEWGGKPAD